MKKNYIGIDIGGTKIAAQRYELVEGHLVKSGELIKHETDSKQIKETCLKCVLDLADDNTAAIGVGWPGDVDFHTGKIFSSANVDHIGADDNGYDILEPIKEAGYNNVFALNDADAQIYAAVDGYETEVNNAVILGLGTGLGVGVLVNGEILWGVEYCHHSPDLINHPYGSIENIISGTGLTKMLHKEGFEGKLAKMMQTYKGGKKFEETIKLWKKYFAVTVADIQLIYRPEVIFISGGLGERFTSEEPDFLNHIKLAAQEIASKKHFNRIAKQIKLAKAPHDDLGTRGAAIFAIHKTR